MKDNERPIANPYVVLREEFDDWAILFNPDTGRGFGLSPTGVYLWKLLDGEHPIDDLFEEIRGHSENVPTTRKSISGRLSMHWERKVLPALPGMTARRSLPLKTKPTLSLRRWTGLS
jgi:SynChlorMet cassette protein ScmD